MSLKVRFLTVPRPWYILLMPALGMVTRTPFLAMPTFRVLLQMGFSLTARSGRSETLSKGSALCRGWKREPCCLEGLCAHSPQVNDDAHSPSSHRRCCRLPVEGRDWWPVLSAKNIFFLVRFTCEFAQR